MTKRVIFTDLDGTLLDYHTYSFDKALPALELVRKNRYPLVLCSSKTKKEIEHYREKLGNEDPFISENGGGIFIPKKYFIFDMAGSGYRITNEIDYHVLRIGAPYDDLRRALALAKEKGFRVRGFGDMTAREVSLITGITQGEAELSKERHFDEPFTFEGTEEEKRALLDFIRSLGLNSTQGRFMHILGGNDKGKAVAVLSDLYRRQFGSIFTIGLGDNPNDIPMLEQVDQPVAVRKPDGSYDPAFAGRNIIKAPGVGPEGWNRAIIELLSENPQPGPLK